MTTTNGHPDCDDMGLAKEYKLQQEIDAENKLALREKAIALGFTDLYGDDGSGVGLRGTISGRVEFVKERITTRNT